MERRSQDERIDPPTTNKKFWIIDEPSEREAVSNNSASLNFLSKSEYKYLGFGETGGYKEYKLRDRIETKASGLPQKFRYLVNDLSLLLAHDYLDHSTVDSILDSQLYPHGIFNEDDLLTEDELNNHSLTTGYDLGVLFANLLWKGNEDIKIEPFLRGAILGFAVEENDVLDFNFLEEAFKREIAARREELDEDVAFGYFDHREEIIDTVRKQGYEPTEVLVTQLGAMLPQDEEIKPVDIQDVLDHLREKTQLESVKETRQFLVRDLNDIRGSEWRGVQVYDVFSEIPKTEKVKSSKLAGDLGEPQNLVTTVLNRLSEDGQEREARYASFPCVRRTSLGWELTNYGKLLRRYIEKSEEEGLLVDGQVLNSSEDGWLHRYCLRPSRLQPTEYSVGPDEEPVQAEYENGFRDDDYEIIRDGLEVVTDS